MNVQVQKGEEHNDAEDACPHPIIGYGEVIKIKSEGTGMERKDYSANKQKGYLARLTRHSGVIRKLLK